MRSAAILFCAGLMLLPRRDLPPMLLIYADGDEEWRRKQNDEMGVAVKAAGLGDVAIREVKNRTHNTVWSKMSEGDREETSTAILSFARRVTSAGRHTE